MKTQTAKPMEMKMSERNRQILELTCKGYESNIDDWFKQEMSQLEYLMQDLKRYKQRWDEDREADVVRFATDRLVQYNPRDATTGTREATAYGIYKRMLNEKNESETGC